MTTTTPADDEVGSATPDHKEMRAIDQRVHWLATAMIEHTNRVRPNESGLKVGGHQASSALMVSMVTALCSGPSPREGRTRGCGQNGALEWLQGVRTSPATRPPRPTPRLGTLAVLLDRTTGGQHIRPQPGNHADV